MTPHDDDNDLGAWPRAPALLWIDRFQQAQRKRRAVGPEPEDWEDIDAGEADDQPVALVQDAAFVDLLERLESDDYAGHLSFLSQANYDLGTFLLRFCVSEYFIDATGRKRQRLVTRRWLVIELIIGLLLRWLNRSIWVFASVVLSLLAIQCHVPKKFFDVLSSLRILYSRTCSRGIARELGVRAMRRVPEWSSSVAGCEVYDNLKLSLLTNKEHGDVSRCNDHYQTIQRTSVHLRNTFDAQIEAALASNRGVWNDGGGNFRVKEKLMNFQAHEEFRSATWRHFALLAGQEAADEPCFALIRHPIYAPKGRDSLVLQHHVPTTHGTADYDDNKAVLSQINRRSETHGYKFTFVVGDQQSYSRMAWLKRQEAADFGWLIPLPGEFHFAVHLLMAVHIVWRDALVDKLITMSGVAQKTCGTPGKWDSVEKYDNFCFLYEALIVGIFTYLRSFIPPALLWNYDALRDAAEGNKGASILLEFLYEGALMWLAFRQSTRSNQGSNMDLIWQLSLPLFKATGKKLYASMCVDNTYVSESLLPSVRELWMEHRTCSQSGNPGRQIEWDRLQEIHNFIVKASLSDGAKRADIDPAIDILNGVHSVRTKVEVAFGVGGSVLSESEVEQSDVELIVDVLRDLLPPKGFFEASETNPFGSASKFSSVEKERKNLETYILEHLSRPNFQLLHKEDW